MQSDSAAHMDGQTPVPGRAAYEPPLIEEVETVDGVIATKPGAPNS